MRVLVLTFIVLALPLAALADGAPSRQMPIGEDGVLRGRFTQVSQIKGVNAPLQFSGHFAVAPAHGLIWNIETPFPTTTIVTPKGSVQDVGGMLIKLRIKNLQHLYALIGGALAGDWSGLAKDFVIAQSAKTDHWQMLLTPRQNGKSGLSATSITVSGARFVEDIVMVKADGSSDTLHFTDEALAAASLTPNETVAFNEVKP